MRNQFLPVLMLSMLSLVMVSTAEAVASCTMTPTSNYYLCECSGNKYYFQNPENFASVQAACDACATENPDNLPNFQCALSSLKK